MTNLAETNGITATLVVESQRLAILPRYAGQHMAALESAIFHAMREYCREYQGGYWYMYELSNGSFYMAPGRDEKLPMACAGNYYEGTMSADAAGIVACLVGFNRLAWKTRDQRFVDLFHALRHFAAYHPENSAIFAAID